MHNFSLSRTASENFPTSIRFEDVDYPINADFRNILAIERILHDKTLSQQQKASSLLLLFFVEDFPETDIVQIYYEFLNAIVRKTDYDNEASERIMDMEYDADVIYTSFLRSNEYGLDLMKVDFLHWYQFVMMLQGLSAESPLSRRIMIRTRNMNGLKGKARHDAYRAKMAVALPVEYSQEELDEIQRFEDEWGSI